MLEVDFDARRVQSSGEFVIDRNEAGLSRFVLARYAALQATEDSVRSLIDVSVSYDSATQQVKIQRGPNPSPRLFYQLNRRKLRITSMPHWYLLGFCADAICRKGLFAFLAHSAIFGVNEVRITSYSIMDAWTGIADQTQVTIRPDVVDVAASSYDTIWSRYRPSGDRISELRRNCREAAEKYIHWLARIGSLSSEVSGGIDSGIVTMLASQTNNFQGSVTVPYPFREFAREREYRRYVTKDLSAPISELNWQQCLPFSQFESVITEPILAAGSLGFFQNSLEASRLLGASIHLTGHGGDRLFRINPEGDTPDPRLDLMPAWISKNFRDELYGSIHSIFHTLSEQKQEACGSWRPGLFHAGPTGQAFHSNIYISGLISPALLYAMRDMWSEYRPNKSQVQKPLAVEIFGDLLPTAVFTRSGKVDHIGTVVRGAIVYRRETLEKIQTGAVIFELLGLDRNRFLKYTEEVCAGLREPEWFFSAVHAILVWYTNAMNFGLSDESTAKLHRLDVN